MMIDPHLRELPRRRFLQFGGPGALSLGQHLLVARRLVEAGIPCVNVYDDKQQGKNWDSYAQNLELHKRDLLPSADKALCALLQ